MLLKTKSLIILYIYFHNIIFADSYGSEQIQSINKRKRDSEIDSVDTNDYALQENKKSCTSMLSDQGLNESSTSVGNQNIDELFDGVWFKPFMQDCFNNIDNSNKAQNSNETVQNICLPIIDESQNTLYNFNADSATMNGLTNLERAVITLPNETQNISNTVEYINNGQLIQNIGDQEYTTYNDMNLDKKALDDVSDINITAEDIEKYFGLSEYDDIDGNSALNPQFEGLTVNYDYLQPEEIITYFESINDTENIQTGNKVNHHKTPEFITNDEDAADRLVIKLNEAETTIFTNEGGRSSVNEIPEDKQAFKNDKPIEEFNFLELLNDNPSIPSHTEESEKDNLLLRTQFDPMVEDVDTNSLGFDASVLTLQYVQNDESTSNITHAINIYEKVNHQKTLPFDESIFNQTVKTPEILSTPITENISRENKEVNMIQENSIYTTCVLMDFSEDNKIFKGRVVKFYDFNVLYERASKKEDLKKNFKKIPDFSSKNSNKRPDTQTGTVEDIKKIMEHQINTKLQKLYFDTETCVNLFFIDDDYKKDIFIFELIQPKIKTILQLMFEKYSVDCICDGNNYFKHDIYYFKKVPIFAFPLIFLRGHVRFWSVERVYNNSGFNFILSICVEKGLLESIYVGWKIFDIEKHPKSHMGLFLLRLKSLYIPILERNPSKKISSLNFNSPVIQSSAFRVEKKYISLNDFLEKRYEELLRTIKENKDLIFREINDGSIRNKIDLMLKYAENFYGNYKNISNYVKTPGEDINEGLLLINKMATDINSCKLSLRLRMNFSSEEMELMSFCSAVGTSVCDFIKQNTSSDKSISKD